MAMQNPDSILTIEELAVYLKLSKSTLYKLCAEGKVPGTKVGRHWRFHRTAIDQWIGLKSDTNSTTPQGAIFQGGIKGTKGTSTGSTDKGKTNRSTGPRRVRTKNRENLRQRPSSQKSRL
ncbi:MAG: helix-turn-helix domain-containing protein [Phycisphaerales bacterium]|nr:helix-turn-helix domain-containing protein [Phycisphaerales bacterium]